MNPSILTPVSSINQIRAALPSWDQKFDIDAGPARVRLTRKAFENGGVLKIGLKPDLE